MSLKQIKNKPNRSAFDLSFRKCFTAKVGEILPVGFKEVLPGDKFKIKLSSFTRTQPVNSAAFTRIKEYYDYFFVPYRYLWRYFDQFITQTSKSNSQFASGISSNYQSNLSQSPYFLPSDIVSYLNSLVKSSSRKNEFGFNRDILSFKLLKYLGYGLFNVARNPSVGASITGYNYDSNGLYGTNNIWLNPFPLLAYQKICQDYFRNTQWENSNPSVYNLDYLSSSVKVPVSNLLSSNNISKRNMFDLNYCTWDKDLFTGLMPAPQYGDTASVSNGALNPSLTGHLSFERGSIQIGDSNLGNGSFEAQTWRTSSDFPQAVGQNVTFRGQGSVSDVDAEIDNVTYRLNSSDISGFNVLALRQAEALQKWREISLSGRQDYKDQIEKHFGVSVPDVRSNLSTWLGGNTSVIDIGEVVNTNLQGINDKDSSVAADIAGRGTGTSNQFVDFDAKEHGIIMCLYHAVPLMDYSDEVTDLYMFKTRLYDYAIPEFDSVGMQSVPGLALNSVFSGHFSAPASDTTSLSTDGYNSLGYAPRYVDYKTSVDVVTGDFCDTMKFWAAPMSSDYFKKLSAIGDGKLSPSFFKCNPSLLDTIFAVAASGDYRTDNLLVSCYQDIKAVRNLDYNGLPY